MRGYDSVRVNTRVFICLAFLAASVSQARAGNDSGAVQIRKLPPVISNVAAFPRLVAGAEPAIVERINKVLAPGDSRVRSAAKECLRAGRKRSDWSRKVFVTMQGPRYVSLIASDDYFCGGAHPDTSTMALVFDLNTGGLVDWAKLLPELASARGPIQRLMARPWAPSRPAGFQTFIGTRQSAAAAIRNASTPLRKRS